METNSHINDALERVFLTALLLTGSPVGAERAVLEGIANSNGTDVSSDVVFHATLPFAIATVAERPQEPRINLCSVPPELLGVMLLPPELRHVFVLRLLIGLSISQCSSLLSIDARQVERKTVSAVRALAALPEREGRFRTSQWEPGTSD